MPELSLFIPIIKIDQAQRLVYGIATAEQVDRSGEICDYATTKPLYEKWSGDIAKTTDGKSLGNLRAMHGNVAAGKVTSINFNDVAQQIEVCAKVVDDGEWNKVVEGVYTGFSQGGAYVKRWKDDEGLQRYTAEPMEISLVDLPCLPSATFQMIKADGAVIEKSFKRSAEQVLIMSMELTNEEVAARAEQIALVKGGLWTDYMAVARDELATIAGTASTPNGIAGTASTPNGIAGYPDQVRAASTPNGATPVETDEWEQVWKSRRDGATFKTKAELRKYHEQIEADTVARKDASPAVGALKEIAGQLSVEKRDTTAGATKKVALPMTVAKARPARVAKGLPTVARLACLIEELKWVADAVKTETTQEGDKSSLAGQLATSVANLCATLNAMCLEETTELLNGQDADDLANGQNVLNLAAGLPKDHFAALAKFAAGQPALAEVSDQLEKMGARNNKLDQTKIQAMHDTAVDLGAECGDNADKHLHGDLAKIAVELAKANERAAKAQALAAAGQKIAEAMLPFVQGMEGRLKTLEEQPAPLPFAAGSRVVGKGQESWPESSQLAGQEERVSIEEAMARMSPEELQILIIKHAQRHPVSLTR